LVFNVQRAIFHLYSGGVIFGIKETTVIFGIMKTLRRDIKQFFL
jgi:hypothetical protein